MRRRTRSGKYLPVMIFSLVSLVSLAALFLLPGFREEQAPPDPLPERTSEERPAANPYNVLIVGGTVYDGPVVPVVGEGSDLLGGLKEALEVGRQANLPVNISHLKLVTPTQWRQTDEVITLI